MCTVFVAKRSNVCVFGRLNGCECGIVQIPLGPVSPLTSSRTCWRRRQLPRNKLATSYEEVGDVARPSGHVEMV